MWCINDDSQMIDGDNLLYKIVLYSYWKGLWLGMKSNYALNVNKLIPSNDKKMDEFIEKSISIL